MKYDVYAIGNAVVDYVTETSDLFLEDHGIEKSVMTLVDEDRQMSVLADIDSGVTKKEGGGSAANTIVAASMLGGKCFYSCKVANDGDGHFFLKELSDIGIDTNLAKKELENGVTGKVLIMVTPDSERTMNTFLGISSEFGVAELDKEALSNSKYLFIEGYLVASESGRHAMKEAKKFAEENNIKVSLTFSDPSMVKYFRDEMEEVVGASVDLLFCNEEEAMLFTQTDNIADARTELKKVAKKFVVTQGKNGSLIYDGDTFINIEPYEVEAIDSNGAGDMFSGAFLFGITNGHTFASAGKLASKASSVVVSKYGPRLTFSKLQEIKKEVFQV
ncbi:MAG TPA: adenosine kinase [Cytophagales bacterium]|nr:adenosine kinase [Rickettsiales bacterium]HCX23965.1 adenosine kinase [Cytophagales bacterium]|tara:strand:+ start:829 stop:1824 length:996 start_codon:yes stop_codon:yes gene_type:complete